MTRRPGILWPLGITAALLFTVGVNVVMLFAASGDRNGSVVEPDYYRKAVEWDRTMARRTESARLGWTSSAALGARGVGTDGTVERALEVALTDSAGRPVQGAELAVTLIHNTDAAHPVRGQLVAADAPGLYVATLPANARGRWEVRIEARRASERFDAILHVEAP